MINKKQKVIICRYIDETRINHYDYDREEMSHKQDLVRHVLKTENYEGDIDDLYTLANDFAMDYIFCKDSAEFKTRHNIK